MTEAERYVEITSLLNNAGTLAGEDARLTDLIFDAAKFAFSRAQTAAQKEGREIRYG